MENSNQQKQAKNAGQSSQTEDKQNQQNMKKPGMENNAGQDGMGDRSDVTGQKQDSDIDERTNVEQRGGDYQGGAQRQAAGKSGQMDQTGTRGVENAARGAQQPYDTDNDQDIDSDKNTQSGRTGQADKNSQAGSESNKESNRPAGNKNNPSK